VTLFNSFFYIKVKAFVLIVFFVLFVATVKKKKSFKNSAKFWYLMKVFLMIDLKIYKSKSSQEREN
jgi:hypothetical protein